MKKKIIILGIESSCDETAVSIIQENENDKPLILSNIVSSQIDVHKEFGGVVPELAARSHVEKIDLIAKKAIDESNIKIEDIDASYQDVDVPEHLQRQPSITNEQVNEIANIATELEIKMGWPVDIECSYFHGNLYLLQCRPITGLR